MSQGPDEENGLSGLVKKGKGVVTGLALVGLFKTMQKNAEAEDEPGIDQNDPAVLALAQQARELATREPDDDECVRALLRAAGSKTRNLSKAAASVRFAGQARESRIADRANRLLLAAFSGEAVRQLTPEQDQWFERLDEVMSVPVEVAFPRLAELQPKLRELEEDFAPRPVDPNEEEALWDDLIAKLSPVVGPDAVDGDPFLRSDTVWNVARLYLAVRVGLLEEVDYS
jgi:hypothetical protein